MIKVVSPFLVRVRSFYDKDLPSLQSLSLGQYAFYKATSLTLSSLPKLNYFYLNSDSLYYVTYASLTSMIL